MVKISLISVLILVAFISNAQQDFNGSFIMTFSDVNKNENKFTPLLWCKNSNKVVIEIQDEGLKKGISQRVLINPADSTWTMILDASNVKNAARVHAAAMFRDTSKIKLFKATPTQLTKKISGYNCKKVIIESKLYKTELWITEQLNFKIGNVYRIIEHCGMMGSYIPKGDWSLWNIKKGMILYLSTLNKTTGESYTMNLTQIKPGATDNKMFNLNNFIIAEIPEGQHCGTSTIKK